MPSLTQNQMSEQQIEKLLKIADTCPQEMQDCFSASQQCYWELGMRYVSIKTGEVVEETPNYVVIMGDGYDGKGGQYYAGAVRIRVADALEPLEGEKWEWINRNHPED